MNITAKRYAFIFFALTLGLLFFYPILFENKTFFLRDIHRWFYPMKFFLAESFKAGEIPFWCSHYYCGSPFMSDIQSGVFYPPAILFALCPFPLSFNIFIVFHLFLAFCFFYLWIVSLGLSRKSALLMAISYGYGGYLFATINTLNNLTTAIWLPAILWSFNRAGQIAENRPFYGLTVLFISMAILGGEPQLFILMGAILFFYAITSTPNKPWGKPSKLKSGVTVVILGIWAILITMIQLGPTYMDYQHSARLGGLSYEEACRFSMTWPMLKHLLLPLHFGEGFSSGAEALRNFFPGQGEIPWLMTVYPGVIILPLAVLGVIFSFSKRNCIWLIIFLVSLVLALGAHTPMHYLFYKLLPIFRFPEKFMFPAGFSLLVMAAYGSDKLFELIEKKGVNPILVFSFLAIALTMDLFSNHRNLNPVCDFDFYRYHHSALQPMIDDQELFRVFADEMPTPPDMINSINNHHIKWQMMLLPNLGILENLYHVEGVPALELRYQHQINELLAKPWKEKINFLRLANVKYVLSQDRLDRKPELKNKIQKINGLLYRLESSLPRAWIVGQINRLEGGTIERLTNGSFEPSTTALGKSHIQGEYHIPFFRPVDRIAYGKNGAIHIDAQTDEPGILIVSESSYPGWKVTVDGHEKELLWLDLLFQGVALNKGSHHIVFKFRPEHFNLFLLISIISLFGLFGYWAFHKIGKPSESYRESED